MEQPVVLYVRSEKVAHVEYSMPHHDHYCDAGYRANSTDLILDEEDQEAMKLLEETGVRYTLVDLGLVKTTTRIKAKMQRVNTTPTLIYKGRKIVGVQRITAMLEKVAACQQK